MKKVYLLANAHIDPVWQWGIDEGIGAAIATFRSAANLLEQNESFIFCHNEALLYRWVKENDPKLYERISALIKCGRWRVMGGFELQPDCVMPSGEAMIRQISTGLDFFMTEFEVRPKVAVSMDCFGHSRGMVQILSKCGYRGYLFLRSHLPTPTSFIWEGLDGSTVIAHRLQSPYGTLLGHAKETLENFVNNTENDTLLFPWGVGNHGGGPSQQDINDLDSYAGAELHHSYPEEYFSYLELKRQELPSFNRSIMPFNVGGYSSIVRIKQKYRQLENRVITAEKMAIMAVKLGLMDYPLDELKKIWSSLLFLQFHDVLPGTITRPVVESMINCAGYGLDCAQRIITKAFFAMTALVPKAKAGEVPILVYNPHPYKIQQVVECEFNLQDQNWNEDEVTTATVIGTHGHCISQMRKEDSTIPLDWRKRVAFVAELEPMTMNRFSVELRITKKEQLKIDQTLSLKSKYLTVNVSEKTGLIDEFIYQGERISGESFGQIIMYEDTPDPWHMTSDKIGETTFEALTLIEHPKVIADGDVVKEIFAVFSADGIRAEVVYSLPKHSTQLGIRIKLINTNRCKAYKLSLPVVDKSAVCLTETMFGIDECFHDGTENASQRFDLLRCRDITVGVINTGVYGGCFKNGILEKTLLRSPVYCAHPVGERKLIDEEKLYDYDGLGEYNYEFFIQPVRNDDEYEIARDASIINEPPIAVSCFPAGEIAREMGPIKLDGRVLVSAIKQSRKDNSIIVHIYEPIGREAPFTLRLYDTIEQGILNPFEVRAYKFSPSGCSVCELIE